MARVYLHDLKLVYILDIGQIIDRLQYLQL